ncbi:MAG TPA: ATP-dependent DNA ligase [Planctomycetaceae bacterium]|nr:ATP-dependent DNA ligase [Planctomycetaceae bacterium]
MAIKLEPPLEPMEALAVDGLPIGRVWQYEPKWDGFRCLAFRDGEHIYLQSKSGKPLDRYFPELVAALSEVRVRQFVLDGEIAIPVAGRLSFDDLLQRIHPAKSRVLKLAGEHPAIFIVFDLLAGERGNSIFGEPLDRRREQLEKFAVRHLAGNKIVRLSPATTSLAKAKKWLDSSGGNLDGVIAKLRDQPYRSGERDGMQKIKRRHTADCVVGGFRYAEGQRVVGSLLLGLYDEEGLLHHVGFTSSFRDQDRKQLTESVKPLIEPPGFTGRAPGGPSRWSTKRSSEWQPLRTNLVVEVDYDHFTGGRFRHGTKLLRWRPDKAPRQCKMDQVLVARGATLKLLQQRPSSVAGRR